MEPEPTKAPEPEKVTKIDVRLGCPRLERCSTRDDWERVQKETKRVNCARQYRLQAGRLEYLRTTGDWARLADKAEEYELHPPADWRGPIEPWMNVVNPELLKEEKKDPSKQRNLELLNKTIERWSRIVAGDSEAARQQCPLCTEHYGCSGCPIYVHTCLTGCRATPYGRTGVQDVFTGDCLSLSSDPCQQLARIDMLGLLFGVRKAVADGS